MTSVPETIKSAVSQGKALEWPAGASIARSNTRYPIPKFVLYRGRPRRVYGVESAKHQGHRFFVLAYWRRSAIPVGALTGGFGPRGQAHRLAVYVRSDHCTPLPDWAARSERVPEVVR